MSVFQMKLNKLKQEESDLMREIQKVEDALREEQTTYNHLKQQTDVHQSHNTLGHVQSDL